METSVRDRPSRFRTTKNQHIFDRRNEQLREQRIEPRDQQRDSFVSAVERGDVNWFKDRIRSILQWERLSLYLPPWPDPHQPTPTADHVVGLVLHCVILSAVVLGAALVRAARSLTRFVCYVTLHWCIYRGEILPICENTPGPITLARIENATLMESHGFRVILISSRPHSPTTTSSASDPPSHCLSLSHYSSSDSIADLPRLADLSTESQDVIDQFGFTHDDLPRLADLPTQSHQFGLSRNDLPKRADLSAKSHQFGLLHDDLPKRSDLSAHSHQLDLSNDLPKQADLSSQSHRLCWSNDNLLRVADLSAQSHKFGLSHNLPRLADLSTESCEALNQSSRDKLPRLGNRSRESCDVIDQFDLSHDNAVHSLDNLSMGSRDSDIGQIGSYHSVAGYNPGDQSTQSQRTNVMSPMGSCYSLAELSRSSHHSDVIGQLGSFHSNAGYSLADLSSLADSQVD